AATWSCGRRPRFLGNFIIRRRAVDDSGNLETPSSGVPVTISGVVNVNFNDLSPVNRVLNGQYPTGVINWGTSQWYLSGPWQQFTTNSVGFNGPVPRSATLTLLSPMRLVQVDAYNGGTVASTISLACNGLPAAQTTIQVRQLLTVATGWTTQCSGTITVSSSNGWDTNLDNFIFQ